jgi:hypothetical protein
MKQEFEMTQEEMDKIISINKETSNTVMMIGGVDMSSDLTEAINSYWAILGDKYGFKPMTAEGSSKGTLFFLAEPKPTVVPKADLEIAIDKYDSLQKIVDQLESCEYKNEAGILSENVDFLKLKELAKT